MFARICSAAILASFLFGGSAQAQVQLQVQLQAPQTSLRPCSRCPIRAANSCGCARPIWSDAGRIPKPFAVACMTTRPPPSRIPTCAKRCCAASARPACRRSRTTGCRRRSSPRSARPSPRSPSRRCSACSSRRELAREFPNFSCAAVQARHGARRPLYGNGRPIIRQREPSMQPGRILLSCMVLVALALPAHCRT